MDKKPELIKTLVYILPDKDAGVASVIRNLLRFKTNRYKTKVILIHDLLNDAKTSNHFIASNKKYYEFVLKKILEKLNN